MVQKGPKTLSQTGFGIKDGEIQKRNQNPTLISKQPHALQYSDSNKNKNKKDGLI
jgi:hypothetical protein